MNRKIILTLTMTLAVAAIAAVVIIGQTRSAVAPQRSTTTSDERGGVMANASKGAYMGEKIVKTEAEWRKELTPEQYRVLRQKGTERAFTGEYTDNHEDGVYQCAACKLELFNSDAKFESGTGWPSFYQPITAQNVTEHSDRSYGTTRTEIVCSRCGSHLGHVFDDGPRPIGLRYCMNSVALNFEQRN